MVAQWDYMSAVMMAVWWVVRKDTLMVVRRVVRKVDWTEHCLADQLGAMLVEWKVVW